MRRLVYYVAVTADGFIADETGSADCFGADPEVLERLFAEYPETCPAHARTALGVDGAPRHFDTVIMGARTHQPALDAGLTSAYPHLRQIVATHRTDLPADPTLEVVTDPLARVRELKKEDGLDIWLCGGGHLAAQLASEIDEFHLKVNPVLIGRGVPLIDGPTRIGLSLIGAQDLGAGVRLSRYGRGT